MKQEDKDLLLKDLSGRLTYGVKFFAYKVLYSDNVIYYDNEKLVGIVADSVISEKESFDINRVRPYLRPMSSMTEEDFEKLKEYSGLKYEQLDLASYQNGTYKCLDFYLSEVPSYVVILVFDWLNAHQFDYRGLIEKGLAIEVEENNNPYKE